MATRSVVLAIASGFATFLLVAITVTQVAGQWVGFAPLLGLPIGALAGAVATAAVTAGLTGDVPPRQRRFTGAFAGFTVGFVVGFILAMQVVSLGGRPSFGAGAVVGLLAAAWGSQQGEPLHLEEQP
ncbi:hypothetical protein [Halosolutus gelatinilyticus]|uniref:hypothetical protein n=1 Tax=Halosolutus gelatinilyticus TaxID=2931975 RepID=UPI001FF42FE9|nr:hypothetical protein [Halosolutus gelatinilyticus]